MRGLIALRSGRALRGGEVGVVRHVSPEPGCITGGETGDKGTRSLVVVGGPGRGQQRVRSFAVNKTSIGLKKHFKGRRRRYGEPAGSYQINTRGSCWFSCAKSEVNQLAGPVRHREGVRSLIENGTSAGSWTGEVKKHRRIPCRQERVGSRTLNHVRIPRTPMSSRRDAA